MDATANVFERPQWRDYWAAIYEYYTVTGCYYKITMINPVATSGNDIIVGVTMDSYTDVAGGTGNITPEDATLHEAKQWKHMNWKIIEAQGATDARNSTAVISGYYKPGQTRRNVSNDGDVKTWTKTDGTLPTLKESIKMLFYRAPLAWTIVTGKQIGRAHV